MAFITSYLVRTGHSPSIGDIAAGLGVGRTRAKALVHQLATLKMIDRVPGSQRAISVPGLFEQLVVEKLRQEGWKVDRDIEVEPCPQEHLSLVAILEHVPAIAVGGSGDQQQ
ncbi:hypothetical protein [Sphingomonas sp. BK235]|uniref:hypothetical protein n=1 Tax=Sphingomonas sp. BK235 TaxID=2512131 RepID=UPI001045FA97|nr:hypothetical protein [Sphingomonas sp. BK235]